MPLAPAALWSRSTGPARFMSANRRDPSKTDRIARASDPRYEATERYRRAYEAGTRGQAIELERARPVVVPLLIAIASRVYSTLLLLLVPARTGQHPPLLTLDRSPFVAWDAQWYLRIAANGYHRLPLQPGPNGGHHDFAFYPAWPFLIRIAGLGVIPLNRVAVALANGLFVVALLLVFGVLAQRFGEKAATNGVLLLAFAPAGYVFSLAYSEPTFLLLAALAFLLKGRGRILAAAGAMLARASGLAILASSVVAAWAARHDPRRWRVLVGMALAVALTFGAWWTFIWMLTGNPAGWMEGTPSWEKVAGVEAIARSLGAPHGIDLAWLGFVGLVLAASVALLRRDVELGVYSLAAVGLSIMGAPETSMPRHALMAFPAFALLGERLGRRGTIVLTIVFAAMQIWFVSVAFGAHPKAP